MKRIGFILTLFVVMLCATAFAQIGRGGVPPSTKYDAGISMNSFPIEIDWETVKKEDDYTRSNKFPTRIGFTIEVGQSINDVGTWSKLPDGRMIWRYEVESAGAEAISVVFDQFELPANAELYLYDVNRYVTIGAFTSENNSEYGVLSTQMLPGDRVIIEYCEYPTTADTENYRSTSRLNIGTILHIYNAGGMYGHLIKNDGSKPYNGESEWCEVNINCSPEGDDWQVYKKGVVALVIPGPQSVDVCSGSMVNDAINSGSAYLLTAFHCGEGSTASERLRWQFYFNYERPGCSNDGIPITNQMVSGCELISESNVRKGGSDHLLLMLNSSPLPAWDVYYNGWDISSTPSSEGVGIHHPAGDVKKISTYTETLSTGTFNNGMSGGFWSVKWSETKNGFGVTEGGSSGSPLFNAYGFIVGTLTGGGSECDNTSNRDLYGRMDKHWTSNGTTPDVQLKPWLDPLNSGVTNVNGINPNNISDAPTANFKTNKQAVPAYEKIKFYDLTSNVPTNWEWTFDGGIPSSSTERNPTVYYDKPGVYAVTLKSSNAQGESEISKTDYITVTPYAGEFITIGTGTAESIFPLGSTSKYERSASIYGKAEIGTSGAITSLSWLTNTSSKTKTIKIYLKHTSVNMFSLAGNEWSELISDAQLVFDGTIKTTNRNWSEIDLSSVFQYSGVDNLMVLVEQNDSDIGNTRCRYSIKSSSHQTWSNNMEIPSGAGKRDNNRPNVRFEIFAHNLTPTITITKTVVKYDGSVHKGDIKVDPNTLPYTEKYRINGATEWVDAVSAIGNYDIEIAVTGNEDYNSITIISENALIIIDPSSVDNVLAESNAKVYPNPANDYIMVEGDNITEINIFDLSGRHIGKYDNGGRLNIQQLGKGVYTIVVTFNDGNQQSVRVVVKY